MTTTTIFCLYKPRKYNFPLLYSHILRHNNYAGIFNEEDTIQIDMAQYGQIIIAQSEKITVF